jgi:RNA:NAD 2'-phosphotransferase (TPT1/KptA family)
MVSLALRHEPAAFGLVLDSGGWTAIDDHLEALRRQESGLAEVSRGDVEDKVQEATKARHAASTSHADAGIGCSSTVHLMGACRRGTAVEAWFRRSGLGFSL